MTFWRMPFDRLAAHTPSTEIERPQHAHRPRDDHVVVETLQPSDEEQVLEYGQ